jgi:hypothetical protein
MEIGKNMSMHSSLKVDDKAITKILPLILWNFCPAHFYFSKSAHSGRNFLLSIKILMNTYLVRLKIVRVASIQAF